MAEVLELARKILVWRADSFQELMKVEIQCCTCMVQWDQIKPEFGSSRSFVHLITLTAVNRRKYKISCDLNVQNVQVHRHCSTVGRVFETIFCPRVHGNQCHSAVLGYERLLLADKILCRRYFMLEGALDTPKYKWIQLIQIDLGSAV